MAVINVSQSQNAFHRKVFGGQFSRIFNIIPYDGSPNAALTAAKGSICHDTTNDDYYINTSGTTTWVKINA